MLNRREMDILVSEARGVFVFAMVFSTVWIVAAGLMLFSSDEDSTASSVPTSVSCVVDYDDGKDVPPACLERVMDHAEERAGLRVREDGSILKDWGVFK